MPINIAKKEENKKNKYVIFEREMDFSFMCC